MEKQELKVKIGDKVKCNIDAIDLKYDTELIFDDVRIVSKIIKVVGCKKIWYKVGKWNYLPNQLIVLK